MGWECRFPFNNNRVIWLIVLVFASVLVVQHFALPYGVAISSLFSAAKASSDGSRPNYVDGGLANVSSALDENCSYPMNSSASDKNRGALMRNKGLVTEKAGDFELQSIVEQINTSESSSTQTVQGSNSASNFEEIGKFNVSTASCYVALPPRVMPYQDSTPGNAERNKKTPSVPFVPNATANMVVGRRQSHFSSLGGNSSMKTIVSEEETRIKGTMTIRNMNDKLQRHTSVFPNFTKPWPSAGDKQLLNARAQMENVIMGEDNSGLYAPLYWNLSRFRKSYEMMEQILKIYIYKEGERPVFHQPRLRGIYASEGWFMKLLQESKQYVTTNPMEAHLFYLPFSSQLLEEAVYVPNSHSFDGLKQFLKNYLDTIKARYSFWNRTAGADHFLLLAMTGYDCTASYAFEAPEETKTLMSNCIRALCNADMKEGFQLGKDASLPETYVHSPLSPSGQLGSGKPASRRKILAFFAGKMHGYVRPLLLKHWENKDPDMKILGRLRKDRYIEYMKSSKYCICARGYEVNSPRLVEAIIYGCVPVIISDNFVPPFLEVLNWEKLAIFVLEKDIPNLKTILLSISKRRYAVMHYGVNQVRQHFVWHKLPVKFDIFHMILHSIWYNRVVQMKL